ncbi:MAG: FAD-dependent oxidoreductase, partial [Kiritimatiellia bacterium]|nr:FAD-dependent oxidoreductase [Kiritimatiellia bacterium]
MRSAKGAAMSEEQTTWRCTVCGYVHRGLAPPEFCPICGAAAADFEPYEESSAGRIEPSSKRWGCLNCGYVHEGDRPPEMCPICGAGPERFEHLPDSTGAQNESTIPIKAVIVGGGIAGVSAAEAIREVSEKSSITMVSHEPRPPYYRLNLTRYLAGEIDESGLMIHEPSWYEENRIELLTDRRIVDLSIDSQFVELADGKILHYDKLILAMGSHPFVPPIPGTDLEGVFTMRTAENADAILERVASGVACVCIGGGILGLETAGALAKRGADVTLLESHEWLMPRQLNENAADLLESHLERLGVKLRKAARTAELAGSDGMVCEVVLKDGNRIPCGMVVICAGVRPNTYLARKAGLEVDRGVVVDNHLITSDPDVLAAW